MLKYSHNISKIILVVIYFSTSQLLSQVNPFVNGMLGKYYDPNKVNFSEEFQRYLLSAAKGNKDISPNIQAYDLSPIWLSGLYCRNGVIGSTYKRIQVYISSAKRNDAHLTQYSVHGKTKVGKIVRKFSGWIQVRHAFEWKDTLDVPPNSGTLIAEYLFKEDSSLGYTGTFQGNLSSDFVLLPSKHLAYLDTSYIVADGYANNTFVGTWTQYKSTNAKKCIWGDYRLPYTFDFDKGDGEMYVNPKYRANGWQSYDDNTESKFDSTSGRYIPVDQWWK